jgi:hypothetical protein
VQFVRQINGIHTIVKSLEPAKKEAARMAECEYCHEDLEGYVKPLEKNGNAYLDTRCINAPKLIVGFGRAIRVCNIKFCPMCGRRLTDG